METQRKENRKRIKKDASHMGWGLIIYTILSIVIVMIPIFIAGVYLIVNYSESAEQNAIFTQILEQLEASGTFSIIGVCLGTLFLFAFFRKSVTISTITQKGKKMNINIFLQVLCVFLGCQFFFIICDNLLEKGLNLIGYSAVADIEAASEISTTFSMFLYASVVGPIVEELIYRGFVLRSFQKYGKIAAIIISSILFGVMHANIPQGMFAFAVGLVLGYVAIEYSIWWAIALHIFNNCIFNDLFGMALSGLNEQMQNMISIVVIVFFGIAGGFILWKNRHRIKKFIEENRTEKRVYFYIFSAVGMFLFIAAEMFIAITSLQKI